LPGAGIVAALDDERLVRINNSIAASGGGGVFALRAKMSGVLDEIM